MFSNFKWIADILYRIINRVHFIICYQSLLYLLSAALSAVLHFVLYKTDLYILLCWILWTTLNYLCFADNNTGVWGASLPNVKEPKVRTLESLGTQTSKIIPTNSIFPFQACVSTPPPEGVCAGREAGAQDRLEETGVYACNKHLNAQIQPVLMQGMQYSVQSFYKTLPHDPRQSTGQVHALISSGCCRMCVTVTG